MTFRTQYDCFKVESETGSRMSPVYSSSYDEHGVLVLEQVGERDIYADIQSHYESTCITTILRKYSLGDSSVLSRVQGYFSDICEIPGSYQEILNTVIKSEEFFNSLPADLKKKFNNSFSQFLVASGEKDFINYFVDPKPSENSQDSVNSVNNDSEVSDDE